jgi:hypothetical protein
VSESARLPCNQVRPRSGRTWATATTKQMSTWSSHGVDARCPSSTSRGPIVSARNRRLLMDVWRARLYGKPLRAAWAAVSPRIPRGAVIGALNVRDPLEPKLRGGLVRNPGGDLLSQGASPQVPSARAGLTAVFGMGTGVSPPPWPPEILHSAEHSHPFMGRATPEAAFPQPLSVPKRARARVGLQALGRLVPVG